MTTPPAPLEWHPAYRDQTWLLDWLEGRGGYPADHLRLPVAPPVRTFLAYSETDPIADVPRRDRILTKRKVFGPAPFVGRPFVYWWYFASDELDRSIAGDARIRYASEDFTFCSGSFEYAHEARNGHDPHTPVWP